MKGGGLFAHMFKPNYLYSQDFHDRENQDCGLLGYDM